MSRSVQLGAFAEGLEQGRAEINRLKSPWRTVFSRSKQQNESTMLPMRPADVALPGALYVQSMHARNPPRQSGRRH